MAEKTLAEMTLAEMTLACLCVSGRLTVVTICASRGLSGLLEPERERGVAERGGAVLPKVMLFAPARRSAVISAFALALLAWREAGREVGVLTGGIVGLVRGGRDDRSRAAAYSAAWNSFCGLSCGQARYIGAVLVDGA